MKILAALVFSILSLGVQANAEQTIAGPKGGRLLETGGLRAEFFIRSDRKATLNLYNEKLENIPATTHKAALIAEAPQAKKKIEFEITNGELVSKEPLPTGEGYVVIVQFKQDENAKWKNFRIPLNINTCSECLRAEYACTCEGH